MTKNLIKLLMKKTKQCIFLDLFVTYKWELDFASNLFYK